MKKAIFAVGLVALATMAAGSASADPCEAIPDRGPMPANLRKGNMFSGPVTYVGDGDSLCVALGNAPTQWVEVRLADFYAAELSSTEGPAAKRVLEQVALGRVATCVADHRSYDRIVAHCSIAGVPISTSLRSAGVLQGGNGISPKGRSR